MPDREAEMAMSNFPPSALPSPTSAVAYPLNEFYTRSGFPAPPLQEVDSQEVPEPYRSLLVHQHDMTSTLENFYQRAIHLRVVSREQRGDEYFREVVLLLDGDDKAVEFGAIKINLARFPESVRQHILEERRPLGSILNECALAYVSKPKAFLRIASDKLISGLLNLTGTHVLYGRRNTLFDLEEQPLAEIVEILPPAPRLT